MSCNPLARLRAHRCCSCDARPSCGLHRKSLSGGALRSRRYGRNQSGPKSLTRGTRRRRYSGTRWCGPGGAGTPDGQVDAACHLHDLCLEAAGLDASINTNSSVHLSLPQADAAQICNQSLFNAVRQYPNEAGSFFLAMAAVWRFIRNPCAGHGSAIRHFS